MIDWEKMSLQTTTDYHAPFDRALPKKQDGLFCKSAVLFELGK